MNFLFLQINFNKLISRDLILHFFTLFNPHLILLNCLDWMSTNFVFLCFLLQRLASYTLLVNLIYYFTN